MNDYRQFSYWFSETIKDPNGQNVSDINKGIKRLFTDLPVELNDLNKKHMKFIIDQEQDGKPDIVAHIKYQNQNLWWYVCLCSSLDDPFKEFVHDQVLFVFEEDVLKNHTIKESNQTSNKKESKIGKIIELN